MIVILFISSMMIRIEHWTLSSTARLWMRLSFVCLSVFFKCRIPNETGQYNMYHHHHQSNWLHYYLKSIGSCWICVICILSPSFKSISVYSMEIRSQTIENNDVFFLFSLLIRSVFISFVVLALALTLQMISIFIVIGNRWVSVCFYVCRLFYFLFCDFLWR